MSHRIALAAASVAATATLVVALAAAGFAPGSPRTAATPATTITTADPTADPTTTDPAVQVDTVYVAAPPAQQTITVHRVVRTSGGENDGEHESGGDD